VDVDAGAEALFDFLAPPPLSAAGAAPWTWPAADAGAGVGADASAEAEPEPNAEEEMSALLEMWRDGLAPPDAPMADLDAALGLDIDLGLDLELGGAAFDDPSALAHDLGTAVF
jgi:hypothetical protein